VNRILDPAPGSAAFIAVPALPQLSASLLSGDFGRLAERVAELGRSGSIAGLRIDVMDGLTAASSPRMPAG